MDLSHVIYHGTPQAHRHQTSDIIELVKQKLLWESNNLLWGVWKASNVYYERLDTNNICIAQLIAGQAFATSRDKWCLAFTLWAGLSITFQHLIHTGLSLWVLERVLYVSHTHGYVYRIKLPTYTWAAHTPWLPLDQTCHSSAYHGIHWQEVSYLYQLSVSNKPLTGYKHVEENRHYYIHWTKI